jgi:hypothetical protein
MTKKMPQIASHARGLLFINPTEHCFYMMMNTASLYQFLLEQLPEKPNLTLVQTPSPCPEPWPLLLKELRMARRQVIGFVVSDGTTQVVCKASVPEVYDKVLALDVGSIIHLRGALPVFMESEKAYGLEIESILTLKEFDDELQRLKAKEDRRKAKMQAQLRRDGYLEDVQADTPPPTASTQPENLMSISS